MKSFISGICSPAPSATAVAYMHWGNMASAPTIEGNTDGTISFPLQATRFFVVLDTAPGVGKSWKFTVRINGRDTPLSVTISDNALTANVNGVAPVSDGDTMAISSTPTGTPTLPTAVKWYIEVQSPISFPLLGLITGGANVSAQSFIEPVCMSAVFETVDIETIIPIACTMRRLRVRLSASPGTGTSYTITLVKNGVDQPLTVTIQDTFTSAIDLAHAVGFAAGDTASLRVTPNNTPGSRAIRWCIECIPNTLGQAFLIHGNSANMSPTATWYDYVNASRAAAAPSGTEPPRSIPVPVGPTLTDFYGAIGVAPGAAGKSYDLVFRRAGLDAALINIADPAVSGALHGQNIAPADGDLCSLKTVPHNTPATTNAKMSVVYSYPNPTGQGKGIALV